MMICRRLADAPTPERAFDRVSDLPWCIWLDSSDPRPETGRWSFLTLDPYAVLVALDGRAWWLDSEGIRDAGTGGLQALASVLRESRDTVLGSLPPAAGGESVCPIPFPGGAAGFLSYELGSEIETLPPPRSRDLGVPDLELGFYDVVVGWDHVTGTCHVVSNGLPLAGAAARNRASGRVDEIASWIRGTASPPDPMGALSRLATGQAGPESGDSMFPTRLETARGISSSSGYQPLEYPVPGADGLLSGFTRATYVAAVREAIERIRAGDIFQVNLSQRFTTASPPDPAAFYRELRRRSPAPFSGFFRGSSCVIAGASPERFVVAGPGGRVQARPIKGTRRRGTDRTEDEMLASALVSSDKDRAENLMIADLLRNDVSRVCLPGSVRAAELFRLESYANVHHLVSVIEGRLRPENGPDDIMRAMFPCGSVTGAPKIRAMEIIAGLEPVARGPCYGAFGWIGIDGRMDLNVAIRTAVITRGRTAFHSGGAIVADSNPEDEYSETLDKARALAATLSYEI